MYSKVINELDVADNTSIKFCGEYGTWAEFFLPQLQKKYAWTPGLRTNRYPVYEISENDFVNLTNLEDSKLAGYVYEDSLFYAERRGDNQLFVFANMYSAVEFLLFNQVSLGA